MNRPLLLAALALLLILAGALVLLRPIPSDHQGGIGAPAPDPATNRFIICPGNPRCPKPAAGDEERHEDY